ncbi:MAG: hypothetical protein ACREE2_00650 [Stellaceae bacterium]
MRRSRLWLSLLVALAGFGGLSGCYYDPYTGGYYPYPPYAYPYGPPPYPYPAPPPGANPATGAPPPGAPLQQAPLPPP